MRFLTISLNFPKSLSIETYKTKLIKRNSQQKKNHFKMLLALRSLNYNFHQTHRKSRKFISKLFYNIFSSSNLIYTPTHRFVECSFEIILYRHGFKTVFVFKAHKNVVILHTYIRIRRDIYTVIGSFFSNAWHRLVAKRYGATSRINVFVEAQYVWCENNDATE